MPQRSLAECVKQLDKAGLLTRYHDVKRVDELIARTIRPEEATQ